MQFRLAPVTVSLLVVALAGCTAEEPAPPATAPTGPLTPVRAEGSLLPESEDVVGYVLGLGDDGTPAVVWTDPAADTARIGVGDPEDWTVSTPDGVISFQDVATPAVADDGSVAALAVPRDADSDGVLTVLRIGPDGTVTTTPVPDVAFSDIDRIDVDAVSGDGRTAVVVKRLFDLDLPVDPPRLEVITVDLPTGTLLGRTSVDVQTGGLDVGIGPDGAVSVLAGRTEDSPEPTRLLRFDTALQPVDDVPLEPAGTATRAPQLALTPDGTAVVTLVTGDPANEDDVTTLLRTVGPGSSTVQTVAELPGRIAVDPAVVRDTLLAGIDGWAYLLLRDVTADSTDLIPLDLSTGVLAEPVPTCDGGIPELLARSGDGRSVAVVFSCAGELGDRLLVLEQV